MRYNKDTYPYPLPFDNSEGKDVFREIEKAPELPDVDEDFKEQNCYKNNILLKASRVSYPYLDEHVIELGKCKNDVFYFITNYVNIVTLDDGIQPFDLYQYQKNMIKLMDENRFSIFTTSRQAGKCITYDTLITIRNKKTKKVEKIKIGDFYNLMEKRDAEKT